MNDNLKNNKGFQLAVDISDLCQPAGVKPAFTALDIKKEADNIIMVLDQKGDVVPHEYIISQYSKLKPLFKKGEFDDIDVILDEIHKYVSLDNPVFMVLSISGKQK